MAAGAASEARVPGFQTRRRYFPDTGRRSPRDPFAGDPLLTGSKRGRRTGSGCARTAPTHPPTHCCELCRWREGALAWEWPPRDSWQENGDLVTDKETDLPCRDGVPAHTAALAWWPFVSFSAVELIAVCHGSRRKWTPLPSGRSRDHARHPQVPAAGTR